jgi:putative nucleotidyltransferase with HDIG domain
MTVMNIIQNKGFVTWTTAAFAVGGIFILVMSKGFHNRRVSVIGAVVISALTFSYYAISGANEGFAILWTMLMPLAICYFMGVKEGIILSLFFETLVVVLFYTPIRAQYDGVYTVTFMNRFPIVYLCGLMITAVSMTQYHESVLVETEYTERLNEEVKRQTKVAVEQSRIATEQSRIATERANQLELISEEMVETLARTIDAKDRYTNGHSFRVAEYAVALARKLGWSEAEIRELEREGLLHDIGKIGVPDAVLNKPGRLTEEEFDVIKSHTTVGKTILEGLDGMKAAAEVAAYHHERYDGKGYPEGLKGKAIPEHARLISIADAYDAMHSDRIYRKALPDDVILEEMKRGSGQQFDPDYLPVFLEMLEEKAL